MKSKTINTIRISVMLLGAVACAHAATAEIDANTKYQRISGFGASSAWNSINATENNYLFDTTTGAGLSLLRLRIDESAAPSKALITSGSNQEQIQIAKAAMAKGAKIWASPWAPPAAWQTSPGTGKHTFNMTYASQWAKMLADYTKDMKTAGVPLIGISSQNEPDGDNFNYMPATTVRDWIRDYLGPAMEGTGVKILAPEKVNWCGFSSYLDAIMNDAKASAYVPIIAIHEYGCSPGAYPKIAAAGKEFWQTEIYESINVEDAGINSGLNTAKLMHEALVIASVNAWHYWWVHGGHATGLFLNNSSSTTKRMWVMGNYSRFVRPGYSRISATASPTTGVTLSAYRDSIGSKISVVAINTNSSATSQTFSFKNASPSKVVPWITDASRDLVAQTEESLTSTSYTYSLPARSVTTLVFQVGNPQPISSSSSVASSSSALPVSQGAYSSVASIPGTIQVENYDVGGEGVAYHDADESNSGNIYRTDGVDITGNEASGYKVGWTLADEWLEYTVNIPTAGKYNWEAKVSMGGDSAAFHVDLDGTTIIDRTQIINTGSWDTYTTLKGTTRSSLPAGTHIIRLSIDRSYANFDWISFSSGTVRIQPQILSSSHSNRFQIFDLHGKQIGEISCRSDKDLSIEISNQLHRSGVFIVKQSLQNGPTQKRFTVSIR